MDVKLWEEVPHATFSASLSADNLIGSGAFGRVYKVFWRQSYYALKEIVPTSGNIEKFSELFQRELNTLVSLRHAKVVMFVAASTTKIPYYIISEYMDGGDLAKLIKNNPTGLASEETIRNISSDILEGLTYVHARGIIHRDLKGNILLSEEKRLTAKIADFGCAKDTNISTVTTMTGTPLYMAPEMLMEEKELYGPPLDIYSFGVMLYEMVLGEHPFLKLGVMRLGNLITKGDRPPVPEENKWKELISNCWHQNPSQRFTAEQAFVYLKKMKDEEKQNENEKESESEIKKEETEATETVKLKIHGIEVLKKEETKKSPSGRRRVSSSREGGGGEGDKKQKKKKKRASTLRIKKKKKRDSALVRVEVKELRGSRERH